MLDDSTHDWIESTLAGMGATFSAMDAHLTDNEITASHLHYAGNAVARLIALAVSLSLVLEVEIACNLAEEVK